MYTHMEVKIKKLFAGAFIPEKATPGSAAYDVRLPEDVVLAPHKRRIVPLEIALEMPYGIEAKIEPRSGFSSKGILDANDMRRDADVIVGKIDSDYRAGIGVIIVNHESFPIPLSKGTHIAQLTFYKVEDAEFVLSENLSETERGLGGFGHSGK